MTTTVSPSKISGTITAPPSKSVAQRALAAAIIRRGKTVLENVGTSADELVVLNILREAGCSIHQTEAGIIIDSTDASGRKPATINFGESGLAARMLIPLFALQENEITFTGTGSLLQRPMAFLTDALSQLNVKIVYSKGTLPITVQGPLLPQDITVNGSLSSQAITGLIMAFAAAGAEDVTIKIANPVSKPYIALTLKVLEDMGLPTPITNDDFTAIHFTKKKTAVAPAAYRIEGDWSAAAMLLVAGAIAGKLSISGLDVFTAQGDKVMLNALMDAGAQLSITATQIAITKAALKAFHFNATDTPDLFPPLAVLAACAGSGTSVIEGIHRLKNKESDRALTLQTELGKMGIKIFFQDDLMLVEGGAKLTGALVDSHGDHRIVMACAIAAVCADGETVITHSEAVKKSYPHFFEDLQSLGATISHA